MVKIQAPPNCAQYRVTIPKDVIRMMNWDKGTELTIVNIDPREKTLTLSETIIKK